MTKVDITPSKRRCKKIIYDDLVMCNVELQMHQYEEWSLSIYGKLKGRRDD